MTWRDGARRLGWDDELEESWQSSGATAAPVRVARLDRGWSSTLVPRDAAAPIADEPDEWGTGRLRNLGAEVAVGDWVVPSPDGERVETVVARHSAFVRRASFEGARAQRDVLAANVDVVFLTQSAASPPNPRRLERELVLAYDSGADPVVLVTKADLIDDVDTLVAELAVVALGAPVLATSGRDGTGLDVVVAMARPHRTMALLGTSGTGKSTLVNAILGGDVQDTGEVRDHDQRGRHTTTASQLLAVPGGGWIIDTPGVRAVSLWLSGDGIERAFADVFDLMDQCRFRDCKHDHEPGCAVQAAIAAGQLDPARFANLERIVAEELALEEEQRANEKAADRRRKPSRRQLQQADRDERW